MDFVKLKNSAKKMESLVKIVAVSGFMETSA